MHVHYVVMHVTLSIVIRSTYVLFVLRLVLTQNSDLGAGNLMRRLYYSIFDTLESEVKTISVDQLLY